MIGSPCLHRAHIEAPWRADVHTVKSDADLMPMSSVARMSTAIAELDEGEFTEGHELDGKWKVPKEMIGRQLSQEQAKRLLAKFA